MSKYRIPWTKIMASKKARLRAARSRAIGKVARRNYARNLRVPLRYGATELKFLDTAWDGVQVNSTTDGSSGEVQPSSGCTNAISVPAQGDGESSRDGRKYTIKSVWVSGVITQTDLNLQNALTGACGFYFALVLDTQANGATIVSENVFINPSTQTRAMVPQPLRNLQNSKRYRILASQYIAPGPVTTGNDAAATFTVNTSFQPIVSLSWKGNIICDSTGTTANVTSASDNAIHLVAYAGSGQFNPVFTGKCRVRFVG